YLAPEVLSEDAELDTKVDIWAAGVVLYEMLHGFTPFRYVEAVLSVQPLGRNSAPKQSLSK
ncbi:unnamed protein product, partial [Sphacelaria rigidula]